MLLALITSHEVCGQVLSGLHLVKESDVEVWPERLPSSLLDYRVSLPRLSWFLVPEAWLLQQPSSTYFSLLFVSHFNVGHAFNN